MDVCFESLTGDDSAALDSEAWQGARFSEVWKAWAEHGLVLKLVRCDGSDESILGLLRPGTARRISGGINILQESLLETSPKYRYDRQTRAYRGIGRVLVARLVEESKAQGAEGRILVTPADGSASFYRALGFQDSQMKQRLRLGIQEAEALLGLCRPSPLSEEQGGKEQEQ